MLMIPIQNFQAKACIMLLNSCPINQTRNVKITVHSKNITLFLQRKYFSNEIVWKNRINWVLGECSIRVYLIQNSTAVKKCAASKRPLWKRCEIQGGGQEMAVMVG